MKCFDCGHEGDSVKFVSGLGDLCEACRNKIKGGPCCPLVTARDCRKDKCAWWADNECAVVTIAKGVYKVQRGLNK